KADCGYAAGMTAFLASSVGSRCPAKRRHAGLDPASWYEAIIQSRFRLGGRNDDLLALSVKSRWPAKRCHAGLDPASCMGLSKTDSGSGAGMAVFFAPSVGSR